MPAYSLPPRCKNNSKRAVTTASAMRRATHWKILAACLEKQSPEPKLFLLASSADPPATKSFCQRSNRLTATPSSRLRLEHGSPFKSRRVAFTFSALVNRLPEAGADIQLVTPL